MNQDYLYKLTLAVYRVTDCFPEKEPLRYAIREAAGKIYAAGIAGCASSALQQNILLLKGYFALAKAQNWVAEENFLVLEKEYEQLLSTTREENNVRGQTSSKTKAKTTTLGAKELGRKGRKRSIAYSPEERKQKLINLIHQEERITLKDIMERFPGVHKRTLIRDLERLQKEDIIKKEGNGRRTFYFPNGGMENIGQMVTEDSATV